ncbi:hypothetical protein JOB18_024130 [Solea senegalensis]|uniref:Uncharacterized protein n=1 Tax=Solea senegalensis TaxID=28829 RepID=A0AAV6RYS3_SOLSE|nr:hypothetical protein JOB18_024130 [Solea senegalensis]
MRAHAQRNTQMQHAHTDALTHARTHMNTAHAPFHTAAKMGNRQFSSRHVAAVIALRFPPFTWMSRFWFSFTFHIREQ